MTPRLFFLALATTVNAYLQASQFAEDTCSILYNWEVAGNMTSSAQYLLDSHERSFSLSENCAGHLETAFKNCTDGSKFLCSEFSISVTNTKNAAKGPRSVALAKKSQSDQTSSAESGCTCSTSNVVLTSSSASASESSAITASSANAVVSRFGPSEGTTSSVPIESSTVAQSTAITSSSATAASPSASTSEGTTSSVPIESSTVAQSTAITSSSATAVPPSMSTSEANSQFAPSGSLATPQSPTFTKPRPTAATETASSSGGASLATASICIIKTADLQKGLCYCLDNQTISRTDGDCQPVA